jgi:CBS-domain-containing membrane protein
MPDFLRALLARHETTVDPVSNLKAGIGAAVGMSMVGALAVLTGLPLLIAPLGSTSVLLFGQPSSPLAQPVNIMGGYLVATLVCEAMFLLFPGVWVATALAVGAAVVLMRALRVTHPPAGAIPIFGYASASHGLTLFAVILIGSIALIALALAVHAIPPRRQYPLRATQER